MAFPMSGKMRHQAFTLVELLTVIAIITVLMALLLPVFAAARGKARELVCSSNLRQIGMSITMYSQDYDGLYPWALDAADKYTPSIWDRYPDFQSQIPHLPMLQDALQPYTRSHGIFQCPSDFGFRNDDFTGLALNATPTAFERFGLSYYYHTELAVRHMTVTSLRAPSEVNVLSDASGKWHGNLDKGLRYNVLFADGHTKLLSRSALDDLWFRGL